ncbi:MAG: hypothetical protein IEMM0002_0537 [bacterium]|nr:MAG: hypothetical protein IEMM0002_0537 [bacterium]
MELGILVNTDKNLPDVIGLTKSALSKGYKVVIFSMDEGTKLLGNSSFTGLGDLDGVEISYCDHSARDCDAKTEGLSEKIKGGSQVNNAMMNQSTNKIVVL